MNTSYFQPTFDTMQTSTIRMTLREAQIQLPHTEGATYKVLCEVIRAAARELLFRYREESRRLYSQQGV
jgi:Arc/MetJ-type ribon-helix-helix transcriptional regulator